MFLSESPISLPIRLVDGLYTNQGFVEVYKWGVICNKNNYYNAQRVAGVVCVMLGFNA